MGRKEKDKEKDKAVIIITLDEKIKELLQAEAERMSRSLSDLLKEAIAYYWLPKIQRNNKNEKEG